MNDSAYVLILLKISKYESLDKNNYKSSISILDTALQIANTFAKPSTKILTANCYYNLGVFYQNLGIYSKALVYYDSVIFLCHNNFLDTNNFELDSRFYKANLLFFLGDYQQVIDESIAGMNTAVKKQSFYYYLFFLNRYSQALSFENKLELSFENVKHAITLAKETNNFYELSIAYKVLGYIYQKKKYYRFCKIFF